MIISHKHNFIFLKTKKTAGTSIEIALSRFCGPDDIITPISPVDEELRTRLGYPGPQNYVVPISRYRMQDRYRRLVHGEQKCFYNHMPAKQVKHYIEDDVWNNYYKFCFERNPWDRCVSLYHWRNKPEKYPTISTFIKARKPLPRLKKAGYGMYTIKGEIAVDKVCRFEDMSDELETIRNHVGIPEPLELPRTKSKSRKDKRSYRDILSDDDRDRIAKIFRDEICLLEYKW